MILILMTLLLAAFFTIALYFHTRLAESRPATENLTGYYVLQSLGGVIGGASVSLLAPILFSYANEFAWILVLVALLSASSNGFVGLRGLLNQYGLAVFMTLVIIIFIQLSTRGALYVERSYFGVHKISKVQTEEGLDRL